VFAGDADPLAKTIKPAPSFSLHCRTREKCRVRTVPVKSPPQRKERDKSIMRYQLVDRPAQVGSGSPHAPFISAGFQ
jgi:hypothetical protein